MAEQELRSTDRFRPLRPASGQRLIVACVLGPLTWIAAVLVVAVFVERTNAIQLGLLVTVVAFTAAALVLSALRAGRRREERRYVDRG